MSEALFSFLHSFGLFFVLLDHPVATRTVVLSVVDQIGDLKLLRKFFLLEFYLVLMIQLKISQVIL